MAVRKPKEKNREAGNKHPRTHPQDLLLPSYWNRTSYCVQCFQSFSRLQHQLEAKSSTYDSFGGQQFTS